LQRNIDRADAITVISNHTKKVVEENLDLSGKKIHTIHNGVELKKYPSPARPEYIDDSPFFLTLGVIGPKKNFRSLVPIMHHFTDYKLIIAGNKNSDTARQIEAQIRDNNLVDRIILPGPISDEDKYWLYKNCRAFLFPSIAEGFGLPVIEAMLEGKPVFLSKRTSLPEIGGNVAFYFDNFDSSFMVKLIEEKLSYFDANKEQLQNKILEHAKQFTWKSCIQKFLDLYEEVLNED
jgi:glycosyltransferase involved in cell wall biosynthesis